MSKDIVKAMGIHAYGVGYDLNYWMIDFIESLDGITYLLQVKSFTIKK